jgi:hypothetical protein
VVQEVNKLKEYLKNIDCPGFGFVQREISHKNNFFVKNIKK